MDDISQYVQHVTMLKACLRSRMSLCKQLDLLSSMIPWTQRLTLLATANRDQVQDCTSKHTSARAMHPARHMKGRLRRELQRTVMQLLHKGKVTARLSAVQRPIDSKAQRQHLIILTVMLRLHMSAFSAVSCNIDVVPIKLWVNAECFDMLLRVLL